MKQQTFVSGFWRPRSPRPKSQLSKKGQVIYSLLIAPSLVWKRNPLTKIFIIFVKVFKTEFLCVPELIWTHGNPHASAYQQTWQNRLSHHLHSSSFSQSLVLFSTPCDLIPSLSLHVLTLMYEFWRTKAHSPQKEPTSGRTASSQRCSYADIVLLQTSALFSTAEHRFDLEAVSV